MFSSNTSQVSSDALFVDDVFSTWLQHPTTSNTNYTINSGQDFAGKGGMFWFKARDAASTNNLVYDTVRGASAGANNALITNGTQAQQTANFDFVTPTSTGVTVNFATGGGQLTNNGINYVGWLFRRAEKFFDVVTYTGNGSNRTISHNLGSAPGCIIVKRTDTTGNWQVYHRGLTSAANSIQLNLTNAQASATTVWNSTAPTSTVFSVGTDATVNASGGTYVAYLFAHNAGGFGATGNDNVISCGSFTGTNYSNGDIVNLGYEPQWLLVKNISVAGTGWVIVDNMRGLPAPGGNSSYLEPNTANAEQSDAGYYKITSTGFQGGNPTSGANTFIYIAIRRPMKPPTSGTQVFNPTIYTGTNVDNRLVDTTIAPDMVFVRQRNDTVLAGMVVGDRLRSQPYLLTGSTAVEVNDGDSFDQQLVGGTEYGTAFSAMNGFWCGNDPTAKLNTNTASNNHIAEAFKRASGFFDVVCYTGTGNGQVINHNLGAVPELAIFRLRTGASNVDWVVRPPGTVTDRFLLLNTTAAQSTAANWYSATSTQITFPTSYGGTAASGSTYVAYLFASLPGISQVGSYTGNGSSQTINCGFAAGARFVMIKRTDSTGNWFVWDSARGINPAGTNDPYLALNSTAAEVTTNDSLSAQSVGFGVIQNATTDINVNAANYIFWAVA